MYLSQVATVSKYKEYMDFMKENGFSVVEDESDLEKHSMKGVKSDISLFVDISREEDKTKVTLSYTEPLK